MPKVEIYTNKVNQTFFDQLRAIGHIEGVDFSPKVGEAVEFYIKEKGGKIDLLANKNKWKNILDNMSKEELVEKHRYISELNNDIIRRIYVH